MDLGLAEKTVIVTGGASNIGRAISLTFAREGANVVVVDWDDAQAQKVINEIEATGGKALAIKTDVTNWEQVQAMVNKALSEFGQVDILVNSVGGTFDQYFMEELQREVVQDHKYEPLGYDKLHPGSSGSYGTTEVRSGSKYRV